MKHKKILLVVLIAILIVLAIYQHSEGQDRKTEKAALAQLKENTERIVGTWRNVNGDGKTEMVIQKDGTMSINTIGMDLVPGPWFVNRAYPKDPKETMIMSEFMMYGKMGFYYMFVNDTLWMKSQGVEPRIRGYARVHK